MPNWRVDEVYSFCGSTEPKFLPPYSPELNRIEVMWLLMKRRWLALKRCSKEELVQAVDHVVANFGGRFKMEF